ncbi:hypothetical protein [Candidatus Mycoplasma haematominutum]|uniref:Uncharacterized protein n=1 Tax=Candidatus Mycoplasma haematominutum 'Birmingham 1' TaxID=1116213 RepID=G8C2Z9_9MOLU|nr:hypothetical protein [Candidatus Mycoplasma haematominutum]CCE66697.1 conserved haemoplasma hypothetical protein [Candidatus Mycoplasma haematominutum 'Birmingham 1']
MPLDYTALFAQLVALLKTHSSKYVFSASPRLFWLLREKNKLTVSGEFGTQYRPVYIFHWKQKNYYFKWLEEDYYILAREDHFRNVIHKCEKLARLQESWKVINLNQKFGAFDEYIVLDSEREFFQHHSREKEQDMKWRKWSADKKDQAPFPIKDAFEKELQHRGDRLETPTIEKEFAQKMNEDDKRNVSYQLDYEEKGADIKKILKEEEKRKKADFGWKSTFKSAADVFSSVNFVSSGGISSDSSGSQGDGEEDSKYTELLKSNTTKDPKTITADITELIPSPVESYRQTITELVKDNKRASFFNPNLPFTQVTDLNKNHHFWTMITPQYNNVDSFVLKLKEFYSALSPHEIDQLEEKRITPETAHIWEKLNRKPGLGRYAQKNSSFKKLLDDKLTKLREKNRELSSYLKVLKTQIIDDGQNPAENAAYLFTQKEQKEVLEEIEGTDKVINQFEQQIEKFSSLHPGMDAKFYLSIFGSQTLLNESDARVGDALVELNNQLNEIVFYQREIEKVLLERVSTLHRAKKSEMKLEFLAQDASLSKLITRRLQAEKDAHRKDQLRQLELQGSLHLAKTSVQKQINEERTKLVKYLDDLNRMENIPQYEEESRKLKEQKELFSQKVEDYREELYALKLKVESVEKQYSAFLGSIRDQVLAFQQEVSNHYSSHVGLLNDSMNRVWADWTNKGIDHIEKILSRKKQLIRDFSEIVILKLKKMYASQDSLLEESRKRKAEWEKVYREMVDEFKTLGYYLESPKPSEYFYKYLPKMDKSLFNLSPEMKKLIYYKPSLKYTAPKVNELIGLSPKLLNDEEFLVIDQVWTKLTPIQERKLKEKLEKEDREKNMRKIEKRLQKAQEDMHKRLQSKNYAFRPMYFETRFPQEADEEASFRRLKTFEKAQFHNWKETHFTTSEVRYKFKDLLTQLSKKIFTLKGVENWGNQLNISDRGELHDPDMVDRLSEWDYFVKSKEKLSLVESCSATSFKLDETELYDIEDDGYLSILEAIEEREEEYERKKIKPVKKPLMPSLEEWAKLNFKRYREEKGKIDIHEIKDGITSLEKEIQSLQKASGNYREACEFERARREMISSDMQTELKDIKEYLEQREGELNQIFSDESDRIDLNFEEIGKKLEEQKKNCEEENAKSQ